jgi:hypothetical protein
MLLSACLPGGQRASTRRPGGGPAAAEAGGQEGGMPGLLTRQRCEAGQRGKRRPEAVEGGKLAPQLLAVACTRTRARARTHTHTCTVRRPRLSRSCVPRIIRCTKPGCCAGRLACLWAFQVHRASAVRCEPVRCSSHAMRASTCTHGVDDVYVFMHLGMGTDYACLVLSCVEMVCRPTGPTGAYTRMYNA